MDRSHAFFFPLTGALHLYQFNALEHKIAYVLKIIKASCNVLWSVHLTFSSQNQERKKIKERKHASKGVEILIL